MRILQNPLLIAAQIMMGTVCCVETPDPVVALTFDDGPNPRVTPRVLRVLKEHHALATFFMVGELAQQHPEVVRCVAEAGHAIGNHSWSHPSFRLISARERREQIRACERALHPYGQKLIRPPYIHQSVASRLEMLEMGYRIIGFDVHAEDWLPRDADWMAAQLVRRIKPGSIVILHDNIHHSVQVAPQYDRSAMVDALQSALDTLAATFRFVTIPELLLHGCAKKRWDFKADARTIESLKRIHCSSPGRPV